jgi:anthranilate phosphoribosyltransferase
VFCSDSAARTHCRSFGREGLDEISISGETLVGELKNGRVEEYTVHPEQFNLPVHDPRVLRVANVEESKAMLLAALEDRGGAARDIVALNAGASIYVSGLADTLADGVDQAFEAIASGAARARLDEFVAFTQRFSA